MSSASSSLPTSFQIGADIGALLGHVGPALFSSPEVILEELLQNSLRAGATRIDVRLYKSWGDNTGAAIQLSDNGRGLEDPAALLTLAKSGWSADVTADEDPFGLGFWGVLGLAETVHVRSRRWRICLHAGAIRRQRSVVGMVEVERVDEDHPGFCVTLLPPKDFRATWWDNSAREKLPGTEGKAVAAFRRLIDRVHETTRDYVRYASVSTVTITSIYGSSWTQSDEAIERKMLDIGAGKIHEEGSTETVPSNAAISALPAVTHARVVSGPGWTGVMWPQINGYSAADYAPFGGLRTWRHGRPVTADYRPFGAAIAVSPGRLTPRAPDRKSWIADDAMDSFEEELSRTAATMYLEIIRTAEDGGEAFADAIAEVVPAKDVAAAVRWRVLGKRENLEGIAKENETEKDNDSESWKDAPANIAAPTSWSQTGTASAKDLDSASEVKVAARAGSIRLKGTKVDDLPTTIAWISATDLKDAEIRKLVEALRSGGMTVLVVKGKVQERAVKGLQERGVTVVSLREQIQVETSVAVDGSRNMASLPGGILEGLAKAARWCGCPEIKVGRLSLHKHVLAGGLRVPLAGDDLPILGMAIGSQVHLDLDFVLAQWKKTVGCTGRSRALALRVLTTVAHEMAHGLVPGGGHGDAHATQMELILDEALGRAGKAS